MKKSRKQIALRLIDFELLEEFKKDLSFTGDVYYDSYQSPLSKKPTKSLVICNTKIYDDLITLGCIQNKTYNNKFPNLEKEYIPNFIRGFFDGNGCIYVSYDSRNGSLIGEMVICSTIVFCNDLKNYFDSVNIHSVLFRDKNHDNRIGKIRIRRMDDLLKFYNLIYNNSSENPIYLKRKHEKFKKYIIEQFGIDYVNSKF